MADEQYLEDRKWILKSIEDTQDNIKHLFNNDMEIKTAIATINTKLMMVSAGTSLLVSLLTVGISFATFMAGGK